MLAIYKFEKVDKFTCADDIRGKWSIEVIRYT